MIRNSIIITFSVLASGVLQLLVMSALLRKALFKRFPFVFLYCLSLFLKTVIDAAMVFDVAEWPQSFLRQYWAIELYLSCLTILIVLGLIWQAMEGSKTRVTMMLGLILIVVAVALISLLLRGSPYNEAMTTVVRNLSFCAAAMNFLLWFFLIGRRKRDTSLLLISSGLGVQMAGHAIGHSLRQMWRISRDLVPVGNTIIVISHFLCLFIWWYALRRAADPKRVAARAGAQGRPSSPGL